MSRLKLFGKGIRSALEKTNQLDSLNSRVEVEAVDVIYAVYLLGGTGRDKTLFTKCVQEFLIQLIINVIFSIIQNKERR